MLDETEVETIPGARAEPLVVSKPSEPPKTIENITSDTLEEGIVFMVPGVKEAYAKYANNEEWVDGYLTMVDKIADSKKFVPGDKLLKLEALEKENSFIIQTIRQESKALYEVLSAGIGKAKIEVNNAAKKNQSQSEEPL
jgi:hypothetical protein